MPSASRVTISAVAVCLLATPVSVRTASAQAPPVGAPAAAVEPRHESEQNLISLPTVQPLRRFAHHVRITHRFARDLTLGGFGQLASDLFGLDNGSLIGLDYRFAPLSNLQVGIYRTTLFRTIQVSGRFDAIAEGARLPMALSIVASIEGTNNLRDGHAPGVGVVAARTFGRAVAAYVTPMFVWNTAAAHEAAAVDHGDHDHDHGVDATVFDDGERHTAFIGLGTRLRLRPATFAVLEFSPRLAGHSPPGRGVWGVAIEKQTRGHLFQINLTNAFGTTYGQTALGGERSNIYLGFNLARKW